jgi:hypothetical protein
MAMKQAMKRPLLAVSNYQARSDSDDGSEDSGDEAKSRSKQRMIVASPGGKKSLLPPRSVSQYGAGKPSAAATTARRYDEDEDDDDDDDVNDVDEGVRLAISAASKVQRDVLKKQLERNFRKTQEENVLFLQEQSSTIAGALKGVFDQVRCVVKRGEM